jgi:hypothetical protein
MSKHTPGPFEVQDPMGSDVGLWVVQAGLEAYEWSCIAIVPRDEDRSGKHFITKAEQKANAELLAAAPDLLVALKAMLAWGQEPDPESKSVREQQLSNAWQAARAAIAKTEGQQ